MTSQNLLLNPHQPSPNLSGEGFFERKMREKRDCTQCAVGCRRHPKRVVENWVEFLIFVGMMATLPLGLGWIVCMPIWAKP